jgi:putative protease
MKVGTVTHYYNKIGVAVVLLEGDLAVGEKIKFVRGGEDLFEQTVTSIQTEHKSLQKAVAGQEIGLKVDQPVREGAEIYKV